MEKMSSATVSQRLILQQRDGAFSFIRVEGNAGRHTTEHGEDVKSNFSPHLHPSIRPPSVCPGGEGEWVSGEPGAVNASSSCNICGNVCKRFNEVIVTWTAMVWERGGEGQ